MEGMAQQQHGTRSTFGPQAVSNRASSPTTKFGSGGRTTKTWDKAWESTLLGRTSPGATTMVKSSIGSQAESRCKSAPAHKIPTAALHDKPRSPNIGPGTYNTPTDTLGLQCVESQRPCSAAYKLGTSPRWCEGKRGLTGGPAQPMLVNSRLPVGYLGDAPAWSFHGPQQRRPLTAAGSSSGSSSLCCPLAPTSAASPGPGAYAAACSAFGRQASAIQRPQQPCRVSAAGAAREVDAAGAAAWAAAGAHGACITRPLLPTGVQPGKTDCFQGSQLNRHEVRLK
ncbi:hypothetical protein OEZ85_010966 [Tetradesmus obliquus]|uniref:Uncharacterized protein n=1 Tax=Tetradesmus obliquus TaxID=3088 RepID=A0ABY8TNV5_TETOB|nr:hypothetical protein OEZ85_010966 [Tetradesmus obliquus]